MAFRVGELSAGADLNDRIHQMLDPLGIGEKAMGDDVEHGVVFQHQMHADVLSANGG